MCQMCDEYEAELKRLGIAMDEKVTVEFEGELMEQLTRRAAAHGHDVASEVREIVRESVHLGGELDRDALLADLRAFRGSLPPQTTDSLTLLREDRNR